MFPVQVDSVSAASLTCLRYVAGGMAAATVLVLCNRLVAKRRYKPLPPGPPAKWFWESPLPKRDIMRALAGLVERYGPVVALQSGPHVTVVIGRMQVATEIMEKQGALLVDRPRMVAAGELLSEGNHILFESGGDKFRRLRRAVHMHLSHEVVDTYQEMQAEAAKVLVRDVLDDPKQYRNHVERCTAAVVLRVTYGKLSPTSNDDPEVVRIHRVVENFRTVLHPGAYLVDRIPWLKYLPGYGRQLKAFHRYELALFRDMLNRVRVDGATDGAGSSFGKMLLEHVGDHRLSEDEMAYLAGTLFSAGLDTTASGITMLIMAAACHPDAQSRVQEELDDVVGRDRVPSFGDWETLPQLQAFILEALRWRPVAPLGVAHRATRDVIWVMRRALYDPSYEGIDEHGVTEGDVYTRWSDRLGMAISRDSEVFPNPDAFDPQRWLTEDGRVKSDMHFYTYGFGRRVCPGRHVANRSLYIHLALLLWAFRISERPDVPIDLGSGFEDPIVFRPDAFEVGFEPRLEVGRLKVLVA